MPKTKAPCKHRNAFVKHFKIHHPEDVKKYEPRNLFDPAVRRQVRAEKLARILAKDDLSESVVPGVVLLNVEIGVSPSLTMESIHNF